MPGPRIPGVFQRSRKMTPNFSKRPIALDTSLGAKGRETLSFLDNVKKFIPKSERISKEKYDAARQTVLDLELPPRATEDVMITLQRHETGGKLADWNFNMISPAQCLDVWNAIEKIEKPHQTRRVFDYVLTHIETNSGIVTLTREELADKVGISE